MLCKDYIRNLYENKHSPETRSRAAECVVFAEKLPILQLYTSLLFHDLPIEKPCPAYLLPLLKSKKLSLFLLEKHIGVVMSGEEFAHAAPSILSAHGISVPGLDRESEGAFQGICEKVFDEAERLGRPATISKQPKAESGSENIAGNENKPKKRRSNESTKKEAPSKRRSMASSSHNLMVLLLKYEQSYHELAQIDPAFLRCLYRSLNSREQTEILGQMPITPAKLLFYSEGLHLGKRPRCHDLYAFCALEQLDFKAAFEAAIKLNHRKVRKAILASQFSAISARISVFYRLFPELGTFDRQVSRERKIFIRQPFKIPLKHRILRTYVQAIGQMAGDDAWSSVLGSGVYKNGPGILMELQLYYAEQILNAGEGILIEQVLGSWLGDSWDLAEAVLGKVLAPSSAHLLVKHAPVIQEHFPYIMQRAKDTKEQYYFELLCEILRKYPLRRHAELFRDNLLYFSQSFIAEFRNLIDAIDKSD